MDAQELTKLDSRRPFRWTKRSEQAAVRVADDRMSDEAIAEEAEIARQTLANWKAHPEFAARVREHREVFAAAVLSEGVANRWERIRRSNDHWKRAQALIEARAAEMAGEVAGGETGLLARDIKAVGSGDNAREVEVYKFDAALLSEIRALEKQAAEELGQFAPRAPVDEHGKTVAPQTPADRPEYTYDELQALLSARRILDSKRGDA